jgi:hypothetical protein
MINQEGYQWVDLPSSILRQRYCHIPFWVERIDNRGDVDDGSLDAPRPPMVCC